MIILPIQFLARAASFFHTIAFPFAMMRSNRMARFHSAWEKIRICVSARAFISNSRIQMIPKRTRSVSILVEEGCNLRLIKRCLRGREELESLIASLFEAFHDPSVRPPIYEINTSSFVSLSSLQTPFLKCKSHRETCCKIVGEMFVARSILVSPSFVISLSHKCKLLDLSYVHALRPIAMNIRDARFSTREQQ